MAPQKSSQFAFVDLIIVYLILDDRLQLSFVNLFCDGPGLNGIFPKGRLQAFIGGCALMGCLHERTVTANDHNRLFYLFPVTPPEE